MKRTPYMLAPAIALILLAGACSNDSAMRTESGGDTAALRDAQTAEGAAARSSPVDPEALQLRMEAALLREPGLGNIAVTARSDGVFRLHGNVRTAERRDAAERIAASVAGNLRISNEITVR